MDRERKLLIRMPERLHKAFRVKAAELGRPMSGIVRRQVSLWLEGKVKLPESEEEGAED